MVSCCFPFARWPPVALIMVEVVNIVLLPSQPNIAGFKQGIRTGYLNSPLGGCEMMITKRCALHADMVFPTHF